MGADEHALLDLIEAINTHRRSLDGVAFGPCDPAARAEYRRQSRIEARTVATVRRELARRRTRALSGDVIDRYIDRLVDAYTGGGLDELPMRARSNGTSTHRRRRPGR